MTAYKLLYGDNAGVEASKTQFKRELLSDPRIDWNVVLRILNSQYDDAILAHRQLLKFDANDR